MFVHLHTHSGFSFLDGANKIEALVERAVELGQPALALTDHHNVCGAVRFARVAEAAGIKAIQGAQVRVGPAFSLVLLAQGPKGYANLCRVLTRAHLDHERLSPQVDKEVLEAHAEGLIALSGGRQGEIEQHLLNGRNEAALAAAQWYKGVFNGRFYLELQDSRLPGDRGLHRALAALGEAAGIGLVATADVHYRSKEEFPVHDLLTCVRTLTKLDEVHPERRLNAENYLKSGQEMRRRFRAYPEAVRNTLAIAEQCEPALELGVSRFPSFGVARPEALLRELVYRGAKERYRRLSRPLHERLEHELNIINQLGFAEYFLLVWDVVRYARDNGIRCAGRGSAADSVVAYCLYITDVDAFNRGLLFERFMSLERAEKPDIDIDFDARRRDEVAAYVYEKYGADNVAAVCTYNTFHGRSAVRDLGKAMGLPPAVIDTLAKRLPPYCGADEIRTLIPRFPELRKSGIPFEKFEQLLTMVAKVAGLPRYIGTHLGGLVISRDPLTEVTPLQLAAKGLVVSQFDKDYVEELGLVKLDLLSLRTLGAVDDALAAINRERLVVDYDRLTPDDPETYRMLNRGETIGVFQLESPAQRALQSRLGADRFEDIVASVALIRPGPIQGNMVEPYIARRQGIEEITYLHPKLKPILEKTYGVVLFQEQVIQIAIAVADFTPGEADQLRRVMTKARNRADMQEIGEHFIKKAVAAGLEQSVAETIFSYMVGYAGYGFCEAHAAAFGNTAYKTAYLVRHYPAQFFAALLSHQPMGYYPANTLVYEARRRGVGLLPLDINRSGADWGVEETTDGPALRISLRQVKGMGDVALKAILAAREQGPFTGLVDFCRRTQVAQPVAEALILAGAFDRLSPNRRALLWQLPAALAAGAGAPLLDATGDPAAPAVADFSLAEKYLAEYQLLGVMVRGHYMALHRQRLASRGYVTASQVSRLEAGSLVRLAGLCLRPHRPPTKSGRTVVFLSLEDETGLIDVTVFEDVYQRYGDVIFQDPRPPLAVLGRVERRGGGVSVTAMQVMAL